MARNAEKAMTVLARWRRMKEAESKGIVARRPNDTRDCTDLRDAERFRKEIVMDVAKKIAMIQNPGLGEFKIRDINDEINKMLRLKQAWEARIKELGGPDFRKIAPKMLDREGREVAGSRGYKYFGAAKDLPGVRELFDKPNYGDRPRKNRGELMKFVDADYYGYMDDDDGLLKPLERQQEEILKQKQELVPDEPSREDDDDDIYRIDDDDDDDLKTTKTVIVGDDGKPTYIRHFPVPSQKDIEQALLERRKAELLAKYVDETLLELTKKATVLLGPIHSSM